MLERFRIADEVLLQGVPGITDLITTPGLINVDFADVKTIMTNAGSALMGIGYASGDGRSVTRPRAAISSPLLEASIEGARGVLLSVVGPVRPRLFEVNEAAEIVAQAATPMPTSSSVPSSTTSSVTRCASRSSPPDSTATRASVGTDAPLGLRDEDDGFGGTDTDDLGDDDFDVPEFLR